MKRDRRAAVLVRQRMCTCACSCQTPTVGCGAPKQAGLVRHELDDALARGAVREPRVAEPRHLVPARVHLIVQPLESQVRVGEAVCTSAQVGANDAAGLLDETDTQHAIHSRALWQRTRARAHGHARARTHTDTRARAPRTRWRDLPMRARCCTRTQARTSLRQPRDEHQPAVRVHGRVDDRVVDAAEDARKQALDQVALVHLGLRPGCAGRELRERGTFEAHVCVCVCVCFGRGARAIERASARTDAHAMEQASARADARARQRASECRHRRACGGQAAAGAHLLPVVVTDALQVGLLGAHEIERVQVVVAPPPQAVRQLLLGLQRADGCNSTATGRAGARERARVGTGESRTRTVARRRR